MQDLQDLQVLPDLQGLQDLRVLEYRSVSTLDWQADDRIIVWDGKQEEE